MMMTPTHRCSSHQEEEDDDIFRKYQKIRTNPLFDSKRGKNVGRMIPPRVVSVCPANFHLQGWRHAPPIQSHTRKGPKKLLRYVVESKKKSGNVDSSRKNDINTIKNDNQRPKKLLRSVVESKKSGNVDSSRKNDINTIKNVEEMMTPVAATCNQERRRKQSPFVSLASPYLERISDVVEEDTSGNIDFLSKKSFFSKYQIRCNPLFESKPSNLGLSKELKNHLRPVVVESNKSKNIVPGTHRTSPCIAPARGDASAVVQKVDLTRKKDKNVHRTIPHVVSASLSQFVLPTSISKGGKPIESHKRKGPKKLLRSVVESKKKFWNVDSSRKNDIKVVGTCKDLVDERSLQPVSKQNNVKAVPQVPPYKGRKIISTSEHKPRWKF